MSARRPDRPPRRPGGGNRGRPAGRGRDTPAGRTAGRTGGRDGSPPPRRGRAAGADRGRPAPGARRRAAPGRPPTAAERRAAEVNAARVPRPPRDPEAERARIEGRQLEEWIDEGALRAEAAQATSRATAAPRPRRRRDVDPETAAEITSSARDERRAATLRERLAHAHAALDRERFDEARRIATSLVRELPAVAAVHEVIGLACYRTGRWKQAAVELETAQTLQPNVELLPVLADVYRALRRWDEVERIWQQVRAASPAHDVLAEARIVAAGARADRGDLAGALQTMGRAAQVPRRVRDHHLREWYVLADLYDRAGQPLEAGRWFRMVHDHDPDFVDVDERLRTLGR